MDYRADFIRQAVGTGAATEGEAEEAFEEAVVDLADQIRTRRAHAHRDRLMVELDAGRTS